MAKPNILHILSDQHSPYVLGCYGDRVVQTPNLDRIAARGTVFESAYCPSPICVPSRMSMLTGRHPYQNHCWNNSHILDSSIPTFAHALGAAGYRTILVGRMHSLGPDQLRGYSERLVGDHSPNFEGNQVESGSPGRGLLDGTAGPSRVSLTNSGAGQGGYQVHDEHVTAAAVDVLNRIGIERRSLGPAKEGKPFLLSVGYMLPHQPFVARRDEFERYRGQVPPPRVPQRTEPEHPYFTWWREKTGIQEVSPEIQDRCRIAYYALVDRLDAMIGQVLRALEENGLAQNTLIVYTTDHGEQAGEHGLWWKQTMYEASARVPMLVSWPGVLPEGQRRRNVTSTLDLTATILDAAGASPLPDMAGRSFLPLLSSEDAAWEDEAFSEFCVEEGWFHRMIRRGPWKLIHYHGHRPQLFNLEDDPDELRDLAEDPAHTSIRQELTTRVLQGWDGDAIQAEHTLKRAQHNILRQWARTTHPREQYRWPITREMHYLDEPLPPDVQLNPRNA
ncbi:MAG TPA: sulfatase-like hydrolase/transferase [Chloroflexota bacterium]|nr:sulfatase-like hydrolase/transferase [Chloroflexota bacterium]